MKKVKNVLFLFFTVLMGCNNPLGSGVSKVDANYGGGNLTAHILPAPAGFEAVAASVSQVQSISNTHKADITVGVAPSFLKVTTTHNKTVYLNVQGQMISN
jgi:hypothetical protein